MPIEAGTGTARAGSPESIGEAYLIEARGTLKSALGKITHCLDQLTAEDLSWRPHESHNSIQTIVLHQCPAEFSQRETIPKGDLIDQLQQTVAQADAVLATCQSESLLERKHVQGFETTNLAAIFDSVSHFVGHTHQIVYITRLRRGDRYRFAWTPTTKEQGA